MIVRGERFGSSLGRDRKLRDDYMILMNDYIITLQSTLIYVLVLGIMTRLLTIIHLHPLIPDISFL
jgi:hypothetical protein